MKEKIRNETKHESIKVKDLWFVDYLITKPATQWVRMPFMKHEEVLGLLEMVMQGNALYVYLEATTPEKLIHENFPHAFKVKDLRIHSEDELDQITDGKTKRQSIFGKHYQDTVDRINSGEWEIDRFRVGLKK
jgi:hypothetical protein